MTAERLAAKPRATDSADARPGPSSAAILSLCDRILGEAGRRRHLFGWLRAPGSRTDEWLAVDAYYPGKRLVVMCSSSPGEHDDLYRELVPQHGLRLLEVAPDDLAEDPERALRGMIEALGPPPEPVVRAAPRPRAIRLQPATTRPEPAASPPQSATSPPQSVAAAIGPLQPHTEAFGVVLGLALAVGLGAELYVGAVVLALGSGLPLLAFGIALDACARGLGTIAAERGGEREWAWGCLVGGSPAVAAFTVLERSESVSVEPAPLAGLLSLFAGAVLAVSAFAWLMGL